MIYTASFFAPSHHHGAVTSISLKAPNQFSSPPSLELFKPTWTLLKDWKRSPDEERYIAEYRSLMKERWVGVSGWLKDLDPNIDQTLCCWEPAGDFCHRNLVGLMVQRYRPECWGGRDVS